MAEQGNDVSGPQAAQPVTASQGAQPEGSTLSPDVIQQLVKQSVESALSAYERQQQSQRDKLEKRINDRFKGYEETFKNLSGQDLTPEQRSQLRNKAIEEVNTELRETIEPEPSQQPAAQPKAKAEEPSDPRMMWIENEFKAAGIELDDNAPEVIEFTKKFKPDMGITSLSKLVQETIDAAKIRLNKPSDEQEAAAARVSAAAGGPAMPGNPIADINDPTTLLTMGLTKKK